MVEMVAYPPQGFVATFAATVGPTTVTGHLTPKDDDMYDLGSTTKEFRDIHVGRNARIENFSKKVTIGGGGELADADALVLGGATAEGGDILVHGPGGVEIFRIDPDYEKWVGDILPLKFTSKDGTVTFLLGAGNVRKGVLYCNDTMHIQPGGKLLYLYDSHLYPSPSPRPARDLGGLGNWWRRLYIWGGITGSPADADATTTLVDSPDIKLDGKYWDGAASVSRESKILHRMLTTTPTSELAFQIAGVDIGKFRDDGVFVLKKVDVADYGGAFANYTPPTGEEGAMVVAIDTNAVSPGKRLYIYANGAWNYVDLT